MRNDTDRIDKATVEDTGAGNKRMPATVLITVVLSAMVAAFYYFSLAFEFFPLVMWGYMIALAVLVLVYIFYNRGFTRKGITVEMLPDDWSDAKKREFVADGKRRLKASKWMLVLIVAFLVTFMIEALILFVSPTLKDMLGW